MAIDNLDFLKVSLLILLGNVYVADTYNHRIKKFDSNGNFITKWGRKGTGDGQFDRPRYSC